MAEVLDLFADLQPAQVDLIVLAACVAGPHREAREPEYGVAGVLHVEDAELVVFAHADVGVEGVGYDGRLLVHHPEEALLLVESPDPALAHAVRVDDAELLRGLVAVGVGDGELDSLHAPAGLAQGDRTVGDGLIDGGRALPDLVPVLDAGDVALVGGDAGFFPVVELDAEVVEADIEADLAGDVGECLPLHDVGVAVERRPGQRSEHGAKGDDEDGDVGDVAAEGGPAVGSHQEVPPPLDLLSVDAVAGAVEGLGEHLREVGRLGLGCEEAAGPAALELAGEGLGGGSAEGSHRAAP